LTWALDLDGVVWLAGRAIAGSAQAVRELHEAGERTVYLTNNSAPLVADHLKALAAAGIECPPEDLTTSAQAAASMLKQGCRAAVVGDVGVHEALGARGVQIVEARDRPDAVVVGRTIEIDYWTLARAARAVREGARFIATNTDATFPTGDDGDGLVPGNGALVAFVATASGRDPEVAGKPCPAMAALVAERYGHLTMMAGDRPDTDGQFANLVGAPFGLVLSGVTGRSDLPVEPAPALVGDDLLSLVRLYLR
jgi:4-nitrophenyl phosphatase